MAISQWPINERPREKLLAKGAKSLSDAELLAILFRTGVKGKTAIDLARELLKKHKNLQTLFTLSAEKFQEFPGLGMAKYVQLQAVLELGRRYWDENMQRSDMIKNSTDILQYFTAKLRGYQKEVFACLFLDTRLQVIAYEELFEGSLDGANVHPRVIMQKSLEHNASALIFAHNHPSGIAEPSQADKDMTLHLKSLLAGFEIRVLDHIVVGHGQAVSLAEEGLI